MSDHFTRSRGAELSSEAALLVGAIRGLLRAERAALLEELERRLEGGKLRRAEAVLTERCSGCGDPCAGLDLPWPGHSLCHDCAETAALGMRDREVRLHDGFAGQDDGNGPRSQDPAE